jgi:hypothetical protein
MIGTLITRQFVSITALPVPELRLPYAITVRKSQGLTLNRVVLKCHALPISRVKDGALSGILFESVFDFDRFKRVDLIIDNWFQG